jgi:nucleotide-binding universal stress UspA family protein
MNILLAADSSDYTKRAARYLVENVGLLASKPVIHVLHVQPAFPYPGSAGKKAIALYQREESERELAPAVKILTKGGLRIKSSWVVGDCAECIRDYVKKHDIQLIAMGSHGHGALAGMVMGSFANKIVASLKTPVLIVR